MAPEIRQMSENACFSHDSASIQKDHTVEEIKRLETKGAVAAYDHAGKERKTRAPPEVFAACHDGLYSAQS
ncbi:hypothetical protein B9Z55_028151 [Caenorhabditis nigoni]|uniref:Uncharacterized protein n=1 Tax=Caenorhabditis nigoni TaxID=1611254 RepID=A0A2G5SCZ0_9PELO|nr:hypothetical protein B9Z55_028151 [Caenorhabditis nigoni]